jgi:integrase
MAGLAHTRGVLLRVCARGAPLSIPPSKRHSGGATPHQFRHCFASEVYDVMRDLRLTLQLLGHTSPHTAAITRRRPGRDAVAVVRGFGGRVNENE